MSNTESTTGNATDNVQVCSVCGVKIRKQLGGDRVVYSAGPEGTRPDLWSKVCRHTQKSGCINQDGNTATVYPLPRSI